MQTLEIKAQIQIQKPANKVFEAITNPEQMSGYFIASGSGKLESGKTVQWKWPEFESVAPIRVKEIKQDAYVSFYWDGAENLETLVEMELTAMGSDTKIVVTEKSAEANETGIKWLKNNTEGWANFLACLKAYVEYNINLRKGAFEFMKA